MNICIDGLGASHLIGTSLYSYTINLLKEINSYKGYDQVFTIWDSFPIQNDLMIMSNVNFIPLDINRISNDYDKLTEFLTDSCVDVYHSPNNGLSIPSKKVCKYVSTIHTIYPLIDTISSNPFYDKFKSLINTSIENTDNIITNSQFTKNELISYLKVDSNKVSVIPLEPSNIFINQDISLSNKILLEKYNITKPFIFYGGSITKRKLLDKLLELFSKVYKIDKNIILVIAGDYLGKRSSYYNELSIIISHYGIQDNVLFLGLVDYYDMPYFYSSAICVIDFSAYNDYPLSCIEAINCGAIVICNKTPVNNELLNNSVIFSSLNDFDVASEIILSLFKMPTLKEGIKSCFSKVQTQSSLKIHDIYLENQ